MGGGGGEELGTWLDEEDPDAGETLFFDTEALPEGEAGAEVSVLRSVRPDLSVRCIDQRLPDRTRQSRGGRCGRDEDIEAQAGGVEVVRMHDKRVRVVI